MQARMSQQTCCIRQAPEKTACAMCLTVREALPCAGQGRRCARGRQVDGAAFWLRHKAVAGGLWGWVHRATRPCRWGPAPCSFQLTALTPVKAITLAVLRIADDTGCPLPSTAPDTCQACCSACGAARLPLDFTHHVVTCEDASFRWCAGWTTDCGAPFYLGLAVAGSQLAWQVRPRCVECITGLTRILVLKITVNVVAELRAQTNGCAAAR